MTGAVSPDLSAGLKAELEAYRASTAAQEQLRRKYVAFVEAHGPAAVRRDGGAEHITASCFVFTADLRRTLLCFHRKGRFWVQTGGHLEPGDLSAAGAALREAREEGGLAALALADGLLDLDRHELAAGFGSCRAHWDVGFAALAGVDEPLRVSDESEQVAWFGVDALPAPLAGSVETRVRRFHAALQ